MESLNKESIVEMLRQIKLPDGANIVDQKIISSVVIKNNQIGLAIEVERLGEIDPYLLKKECEKLLYSIKGIEKITIVMTGEVKTADNNPKAQPKIKAKLPGVKNIIAISSCKGGVGKSTTTVNLAHAFSHAGYKVGIADADIYGPSIPRMLNLQGQPQIKDAMMVPLENYSIKTISMGYVFAKDTAAVWRGPMATKAMAQLLKGTNWGELDILLIDMPPGTGDIHLSLAENYDVDGVIIVSTPQEVALDDVKKAISMYRKVNIPILGIIENMSYFVDPVSGNKNYIFGRGGVKELSANTDIAFLGEIPIEISVREAADLGKPLDTLVKAYYERIMTSISEALSINTTSAVM